MRRAAAILLLLSACGPREQKAADAVCPHDLSFDRASVIRVSAVAPPAALRRDLDLPGLARKTGDAVGSGKLQGLTVVEHQLLLRTLVSQTVSRGRACVWFDSVSVDLTPASVEIFVPREYPDGSCEYEEILSHEREHARVHAERLASFSKEIEAALRSAKWLPAKGNPLETADRVTAEAMLKDRLHKVIDPVYAKYKEDLTAAQAELDEPGLYQWVSKRCDGWK